VIGNSPFFATCPDTDPLILPKQARTAEISPAFEEEVRVQQGDVKKGGAGRKTVQRMKERIQSREE
jgi:hypothetical protein